METSADTEASHDASEVEGISAEAPQEPAAPLAKFVIPVLKIIKDAQGQHGLRYGDYQRYRQYCTRRMRRLRRSLKFLHWEQGKGKSKFVQRVIATGQVNDSRFLLLVLNKAERAWAYAMQLRDKPDGQVGREVHHLMRRLGKAAKYSALFEELAKATCDDRTALEAEAYAAFLQGSLLLEQENWEPALEKLSRCRTVYDELGKAAEGADQRVYKERVEDLDPTMRYCRHNLQRQGGGKAGGGAAGAGGELVSQMASEMLKGKLDKVLGDDGGAALEVTWLGRPVPVAHGGLRQHLVAAHSYSEEAEKAEGLEGKLAMFDKFFMSLEDAKRIIRDEIADKLKSGATPADEGQATLQRLRNYVQVLQDPRP